MNMLGTETSALLPEVYDTVPGKRDDKRLFLLAVSLNIFVEETVHPRQTYLKYYHEDFLTEL